MRHTFEHQLLEYLGFPEASSSSSADLIQATESTWKRGLAFTDTAGLTLHLRARLKQRHDLVNLPATIQQRLELNFSDNKARMNLMSREFLEFNLLLQTQGIRYLNLKGLVLYPDFVDRLEHRLQDDHDLLVMQEDLQHAYKLFLDLGYFPVRSSETLAVRHLPTLVKKTDWQWKQNFYDPEIPRGIEVHFRLWEADFAYFQIHSLDKVWQNSTFQNFGSILVPVLSREHTLLYGTLHSFRHLLRNDLRLSHLYELAFFLQRFSKEQNFWEGFLALVARCPKSLQVIATMFELACRLFNVYPAPMIQQLVKDHLSSAGDLWIQKYGKDEAIHCYRHTKNAIFLHLDFVADFSSRLALIRRRFIPRHLPLPSFGLQTPLEKQDRKFRLVSRLHYMVRLFRRAEFHAFRLSGFPIQLAIWCVRLYFHKKVRRTVDKPKLSNGSPNTQSNRYS